MTASASERRADRRFGTRASLSFVAVFLVAIPFAGLVFLVTANSPLLGRLDRDTAHALHGYALDHPSFTHGMSVISTVAGPVGWWVVLTPVFVWLLVARLPRLATFVAVTAIGSSLLNLLIKTAVDRARPHLSDPVAMAAGKSFPSAHTQSATVGFGILVLVLLPLVARRWRPWLWVVGSAVRRADRFLADRLGRALLLGCRRGNRDRQRVAAGDDGCVLGLAAKPAPAGGEHHRRARARDRDRPGRGRVAREHSGPRGRRA